ncbi:MAG TPA: hypothetical protein VFO01_02715 [Trebonia sp.]|nr:hypothetical protein [Trebonia sp.]
MTGQLCPIMLTDITGFSAQRRSDEDRLGLRRTMYDMLQRAFEAAGPSSTTSEIQPMAGSLIRLVRGEGGAAG